MAPTLEINPKNLKALCWSRGMSVAEAARKIKRSRTTIHRAVRWPDQFGPTYKALSKILKDEQQTHS